MSVIIVASEPDQRWVEAAAPLTVAFAPVLRNTPVTDAEKRLESALSNIREGDEPSWSALLS